MALERITEGLTGAEIDGRIDTAKSTIKDFVRNEMRDAMHEQNQALQRQNTILDKIADGMQRVILSNIILLGDEQLGVKGKIQELAERVAGQEEKFTERCDADDAWRTETRGRLEKLEAGQHRLARMARWMVDKSGVLSEDWKKLAALAGLIAALFSGIPNVYAPVKHFVLAVLHTMDKK